ncbi:MAG: LON peptidase substrate-binding domain-containing protein, partial [Bacteroidota bacterium]
MNFDTEAFFEDEFPVITATEAEKIETEAIPEDIGILTLKNTVLFPGTVMPITVGRDKSIQLVKDTFRGKDRRIGVVTQRDGEAEDPGPEDLYQVGTIGRILKMIRMPDGSITIVIQGRQKFYIQEFTSVVP